MNDGTRLFCDGVVGSFRPLEGEVKVWQTAANTGVLSEV